ncbi:AI-2E family transporter [Rubritalea tangerina]|uniref:AI-2E family transporter n=1 Tax=Rubritalea tangerina TaxID=430798 RepID=UPI00360C042D
MCTTTLPITEKARVDARVKPMGLCRRRHRYLPYCPTNQFTSTAPKIVGDSVGLHPMTVIFSMLFWSLLLGGFLGAILAVPHDCCSQSPIPQIHLEARIKDNATKLVESVEASH